MCLIRLSLSLETALRVLVVVCCGMGLDVESGERKQTAIRCARKILDTERNLEGSLGDQQVP
jgi:hypothetical protein